MGVSVTHDEVQQTWLWPIFELIWYSIKTLAILLDTQLSYGAVLGEGLVGLQCLLEHVEWQIHAFQFFKFKSLCVHLPYVILLA